MKFDPSSFPAAAKATGFQSNNLEKVLRMRELLTEFQKMAPMTTPCANGT